MKKCKWWHHMSWSKRMVYTGESGTDYEAAELWSKFRCSECGECRMSVAGGGW